MAKGITHRNGITPVSKQTWFVVASNITDGNIESANHAPAVDQSTVAVFCVVLLSESIGLLARKRATPETLHAIAKTVKATDQILDCCEDEKAGSITNGKERSASIDPTLDSE